jgi:hypothetical protein
MSHKKTTMNHRRLCGPALIQKRAQEAETKRTAKRMRFLSQMISEFARVSETLSAIIQAFGQDQIADQLDDWLRKNQSRLVEHDEECLKALKNLGISARNLQNKQFIKNVWLWIDGALALM